MGFEDISTRRIVSTPTPASLASSPIVRFDIPKPHPRCDFKPVPPYGCKHESGTADSTVKRSTRAALERAKRLDLNCSSSQTF